MHKSKEPKDRLPGRSHPKATRPPAAERSDPEVAVTAGQLMHHKLDALPDSVDIHDWFYQPPLHPLPDEIVNCGKVPLVMDQGTEGACTGFALAAVINYQLAARRLIQEGRYERAVSPRMLYEMARRYDKWPGEEYEGSSARGAMKGWIAHGVATRRSWQDEMHGPGFFDERIAAEAVQTPGGAYYRVMHRNIRDVHAALHEAGIVYATLMVHAGWETPNRSVVVPAEYEHNGAAVELRLPVIIRSGRASSGHAVALVGYTADGFIVQNSWGQAWGEQGFALLPYEDWMLHATDCWVAQLGVPIRLDYWKTLGDSDVNSGIQRASPAIPLNDIRPFVVNIGNNGRLSSTGKYWTTEADVERLFSRINLTSVNWQKRRIMLFLHGGLNGEEAVAKRAIAFKEVCLKNEIYPVHIMWETGFAESLKSSVLDLFTDDDDRVEADWLRKLRDGLVEAKDLTIELTASAPGTLMWNEMKENARLASVGADGGMHILLGKAAAYLAAMPTQEQAQWELHIVAHSAGSIFAAYAMKLFSGLGIVPRTMQFMAPAITTALFKEQVLPYIRAGDCPLPTLYNLSNVGELDDTVSPYGKSLLYLVSNAFEGKRGSPLLGMERFISRASNDPDKSLVDAELEALFQEKVGGLPSLVIAGAGGREEQLSPSLSRSTTHGGFDNDEYTMNSLLYRILGREPVHLFSWRDLKF